MDRSGMSAHRGDADRSTSDVGDPRVMENWSILLLGALIGMQHALEADHLAAVGALGAGKSGRRRLVLLGTYWGVGHTIALFVLSIAVVLLGFVLTKQLQAALEIAVGGVVALLGVNVLRTVVKRRIHFHVHDHGDGRRHVHAHAHAHEAVPHAHSAHRHAHPERRLLAALGVGLVHGAAGSGALLVLTAATADTVAGALLYVAFFGFGSIVGMAALSFVASYPLRALERATGWLNATAMAAIGCVAITIGAILIAESWALVFL